MPKRKKSDGRWRVIVILILLFFGVLFTLKPHLAEKAFSPLREGRPNAKNESPVKGDPKQNSPSKEIQQAPSPRSNSDDPKPTFRSIHLEMGTPEDNDPSDDYLLIREQYALSYNPQKRVPNWVSWNLNKHWFGSSGRYRGKFLPDPDLPALFYKVTHNDYTGSGYDRGHMVRSEERTKTPEDNVTTFYMTNILPQKNDLNAGPWLRLEEYCQKLSQKANKELYIIAGGIFDAAPQRIGKGVSVPHRNFKIIVVLNKAQTLRDVTENTPVIAVIMPNDESVKKSDKWTQYLATVDDIEAATGYDFLSALSPKLQSVLEQKRFAP